MIRTIPAPGGRTPYALLLLFGTLLLLITLWWLPPPPNPGPGFVYARSTESSELAFDHEVTLTDVTVDWTPADGGDFDPRDKCPKDFLSAGFILLSRKLENGSAFNFLYHRGKQLLYRIDKDIIAGKARIGLHWVTSTAFNAKYRIADPAFKGGRSVLVPDGKGNTQPRNFNYGQAVSKRRTQYHRELFRQTHVTTEPCPEWWDLFNFNP